MIEYRNVTKTYDTAKTPFTAIDNVSFTVEKGHIVVFLGPSGCGKTTMLRMTNRLESITRGEILINGTNINQVDEVKLRQSIGYVIQDIGLFPNKTIAENIAVVPRLLGWGKQKIGERVDELLEMVNLDPNIYRTRFPVELSGGQQQRVGVIRALAADPEILLMDEPFGAIDPINREQIQDEFLKLQFQLKKTIIMVSHDIHEAIKMGDRIVLFNTGHVSQYDSPEVILTQPKNSFVSDFVGADRALKVLGILHASDAMQANPKNIVHAHDSAVRTLQFLQDNHFSYGLVVGHQKPLGYVTPKGLKNEEGETGGALIHFESTVELREPLQNALSTMLMYELPVLPVVNENGDLCGSIDYVQIQRSILDILANEDN